MRYAGSDFIQVAVKASPPVHILAVLSPGLAVFEDRLAIGFAVVFVLGGAEAAEAHQFLHLVFLGVALCLRNVVLRMLGLLLCMLGL